MGWEVFFRSKKPEGKQPTAVDYVEWLLKYMLCASRTTLTIDTSRALPGCGGDLSSTIDPPPCMPDAQTVVNRLKILSGINPMRQLNITEGAFERPRVHLAVVYKTRFQDDADKSTCFIRLHTRNLDSAPDV